MKNSDIQFGVPLSALNIVESPMLAGAKRMIRRGDTVYVSPAVLSLIRTADEDELQKLMESIEVITLMDFAFGLQSPMRRNFE
jgi:hypothetical protein